MCQCSRESERAQRVFSFSFSFHHFINKLLMMLIFKSSTADLEKDRIIHRVLNTTGNMTIMGNGDGSGGSDCDDNKSGR